MAAQLILYDIYFSLLECIIPACIPSCVGVEVAPLLTAELYLCVVSSVLHPAESTELITLILCSSPILDHCSVFLGLAESPSSAIAFRSFPSLVPWRFLTPTLELFTDISGL